MRQEAQQIGNRVLERMLCDWDPLRLGWDWGSGIAAHAMLTWLHDHHHNDAESFLKRWIDHHLDQATPVYDAGGRLWKIGPGVVVLHLYEQTAESVYRDRIQLILDYIADSPRGQWREKGDVLLSKEGRSELWVDSLMTLCPFWARAARAGLAPDGLEEAERQIILHAEALRDKNSGLWFHAYDLDHGKPMGQCWSRGMGWALFAMVEVLREMTPAQQEQSPLKPLLASGIESVLRVQGSDGTWRTVLNRPDAVTETSGHALILYALAEALRHAWLPAPLCEQARPAIIKAWSVLCGNVSETGEVRGVSTGTNAADFEHYQTRPQSGWVPWGPAVVLLAAQAVCGGSDSD